MPFTTVASGFGPSDPECYETGNCDFFDAPLEAMTEPFETVFGDFAFLILWGIIIFILWLRVQNTMVVSLIGVALAVLFLPGFSDEALTVGYALVAIAMALAIYQLLTVRTHFPTN